MRYQRGRKSVRWLTQALIVSVSLNVGLLLTFSIRALSRPPIQLPASLQEPLISAPQHHCKGPLLSKYFAYSFYELVDELLDDELVEDGLRRRDLALACLMNFHHLDVERALSGNPLEKRTILFAHDEGPEEIELAIVSGLRDRHFDMVIEFIKGEKWPFTPEGLFYEMKGKETIPESLYRSFEHTDHFQIAEKLFARSGYPIDSYRLMDILLDADWPFLDQFIQGELHAIDFSSRVFNGFMLHLLNSGSPLAAQFTIEEGDLTLMKRLDDGALLALIDKIDQMTARTEHFLRGELTSVRSDRVREAAALKLRAFDIAASIPQEDGSSFEVKSWKEHIVEPGDSLWLISKKYGVKISEIAEANELSSRHRLSIGMRLTIPD